MITQERLKELLTYAPDTGLFFWNNDMRGGKKKGEVAGCKSAADKHGRNYIKIGLDEKRFYAHRLAWLYMTGEQPKDHVDHINNDSLNNSWSNLRLATKSENGFNAKLSRRNKSGFKGVYLDEQKGKFIAEIKCNRKKYWLGSFQTAEEAHQAYIAAAVKFHGEFARIN